MTNTATKVVTIAGWKDAALYKCDPPMNGYDYVIASAILAPFSGPETYLFGATKDGEIADWSEMDGNFRGGLSHVQAFANAGYEVVEP